MIKQTDDGLNYNIRTSFQVFTSIILVLQMYGKNWKKIEQLIGTRNGSQIRSHAQKFFLKFKKTQSNDFSQLDSAEADVELTPKDS